MDSLIQLTTDVGTQELVLWLIYDINYSLNVIGSSSVPSLNFSFICSLDPVEFFCLILAFFSHKFCWQSNALVLNRNITLNITSPTIIVPSCSSVIGAQKEWSIFMNVFDCIQTIRYCNYTVVLLLLLLLVNLTCSSWVFLFLL